MQPVLWSPSSSSLSPASPVSSAGSGAPPKKLLQVAEQFETILLNDLLGPMEKTFSSVPGEKDTPGSSTYSAMGTQALASGLAASGGFGIAGMIVGNIMRKQADTTHPGSPQEAKVPALRGR